MDKKVLDVVKKIKLLAEQNVEFRQEMKQLFGNSVSPSLVNCGDNRISNIEKYLGLDYFVDSMTSTIDYTFVNDLEVRDKLVSDNREMMRFRYGTRSHKIDFDEFSRYVQLQAEMLLNYYYATKYGTIENVLIFFEQLDIKVYRKEIEKISDIPFYSKLIAYCKDFNIYYLWKTFDNVRRVRNYQSHRAPWRDDFSLEAYQKKLREMKIPLNEDGTLKNFREDESKVKGTEEYKKYIFLLWYNNKPYDEIVEKLKDLTMNIKKQIEFSRDN